MRILINNEFYYLFILLDRTFSFFRNNLPRLIKPIGYNYGMVNQQLPAFLSSLLAVSLTRWHDPLVSLTLHHNCSTEARTIDWFTRWITSETRASSAPCRDRVHFTVSKMSNSHFEYVRNNLKHVNITLTNTRRDLRFEAIRRKQNFKLHDVKYVNIKY